MYFLSQANCLDCYLLGKKLHSAMGNCSMGMSNISRSILVAVLWKYWQISAEFKSSFGRRHCVKTTAHYLKTEQLKKRLFPFGVTNGERSGSSCFDFLKNAAGNRILVLPTTPNVGRVAQRKKKFNQFYCLIMILGYKRNSKLSKVK